MLAWRFGGLVLGAEFGDWDWAWCLGLGLVLELVLCARCLVLGG